MESVSGPAVKHCVRTWDSSSSKLTITQKIRNVMLRLKLQMEKKVDDTIKNIYMCLIRMSALKLQFEKDNNGFVLTGTAVEVSVSSF